MWRAGELQIKYECDERVISVKEVPKRNVDYIDYYPFPDRYWTLRFFFSEEWRWFGRKFNWSGDVGQGWCIGIYAIPAPVQEVLYPILEQLPKMAMIRVGAEAEAYANALEEKEKKRLALLDTLRGREAK